MDTSGAELGTGAFVQETKTETKKDGQVSMASQVTIASQEPGVPLILLQPAFRERELFPGLLRQLLQNISPQSR